jgi:hypothetical protein
VYTRKSVNPIARLTLQDFHRAISSRLGLLKVRVGELDQAFDLGDGFEAKPV